MKRFEYIDDLIEILEDSFVYEILKQFNDEWILEIEDITDFVDAQRNNAISSLNELVVPAESVLFLKNQSLQKRLGIL
ncbi:MAG: hypothetical protein P1P88_11565 [Bacteroidales bacterium]|nr:hypothetical protein [Bacteroidales bacterium]